MHSRIFGIVKKYYYDNHRDEHDWELSGFYGDDVPSFADYVSEDTDIDKDFLWLVDTLSRNISTSLIDVDDKNLTITFKEGFKEAYFRDNWNKLIKNLIGDPDSYARFCGNIKDYDLSYRLGQLISEKYGFYMSDEYGSYDTLDDFLRTIDYNVEYKIFDSLDYHY